MSRKIKVGVIGVGALGQWHARIYSELPEVELIGVHDASPARAAEIAAKYGTQAFDSIDALVDAVEAVSVVVPTHLHFEVFNRVLAHGRHMLMEKPIASTTDEAERMVHAANEKNITLQVGHVERFNPVMQFLEEHLTEPRFIEVIRLAPFPPPRSGAPPRGTEVSVVLDLMIHDLEILLHIVNAEVRDIHAVGVPVLSTTEDIANVRLTFANGCVANVTASRIS
ncbi:MAG: Gfo/Idh/MocA family oxidoreductase, partial [Verrucomicrobia bacterium]|nr:Gfo/Idh/MocA family oxidoreductase [Verrucomicrobiota bacterium]